MFQGMVFSLVSRLAVVLLFCAVASAQPAASDNGAIFDAGIRPVLKKNCSGCHSGATVPPNRGRTANGPPGNVTRTSTT